MSHSLLKYKKWSDKIELELHTTAGMPLAMSLLATPCEKWHLHINQVLVADHEKVENLLAELRWDLFLSFYKRLEDLGFKPTSPFVVDEEVTFGNPIEHKTGNLPALMTRTYMQSLSSALPKGRPIHWRADYLELAWDVGHRQAKLQWLDSDSSGEWWYGKHDVVMYQDTMQNLYRANPNFSLRELCSKMDTGFL